MMKEVLVSNPWSRSSSSGRQGVLRTLLITSYISLLCTDSCVSLSIPPCGVNKPHLPLRFHPGASSPNGKKQNSNSCPYKKQPAFESKKKYLYATLKSTNKKAIKGKKLVFIINKKKYTAKTNKKGIAKVKVKLSKKKTYKFTVKFLGDNTFKKITKKGKVAIK